VAEAVDLGIEAPQRLASEGREVTVLRPAGERRGQARHPSGASDEARGEGRETNGEIEQPSPPERKDEIGRGSIS